MIKRLRCIGHRECLVALTTNDDNEDTARTAEPRKIRANGISWTDGRKEARDSDDEEYSLEGFLERWRKEQQAETNITDGVVP